MKAIRGLVVALVLAASMFGLGSHARPAHAGCDWFGNCDWGPGWGSAAIVGGAWATVGAVLVYDWACNCYFIDQSGYSGVGVDPGLSWW